MILYYIYIYIIVNLRTIANLRPISTKAKNMDTYEAITYSIYTSTKDLSYKNGKCIYSKLMNNYKSTTKSMKTYETITYSL